MQKVKLEKVFINDTKSDGSPLLNKKGEPFKMANIAWEGGDASMYIGGKWGAKDEEIISQWSVGDEVTVVIEQNGEWTNFKLPSKTDMLEARVAELETEQKKIVKILAKLI